MCTLWPRLRSRRDTRGNDDGAISTRGKSHACRSTRSLLAAKDTSRYPTGGCWREPNSTRRAAPRNPPHADRTRMLKNRRKVGWVTQRRQFVLISYVRAGVNQNPGWPQRADRGRSHPCRRRCRWRCPANAAILCRAKRGAPLCSSPSVLRVWLFTDIRRISGPNN